MPSSHSFYLLDGAYLWEIAQSVYIFFLQREVVAMKEIGVLVSMFLLSCPPLLWPSLAYLAQKALAYLICLDVQLLMPSTIIVFFLIMFSPTALGGHTLPKTFL